MNIAGTSVLFRKNLPKYSAKLPSAPPDAPGRGTNAETMVTKDLRGYHGGSRLGVEIEAAVNTVGHNAGEKDLHNGKQHGIKVDPPGFAHQPGALIEYAEFLADFLIPFLGTFAQVDFM